MSTLNDIYRLVKYPYGIHGRKARKWKKDAKRCKKLERKRILKTFGSMKAYKEYKKIYDAKMEQLIDMISYNPPIKTINDPIEEAYKQSTSRLGGYRLCLNSQNL